MIDPEPLPLAPPVTDSHGESDLAAAVHGHPSVVVIVVVSAGTVMQTLNTIGATEYWQPPISPDCVIAIVCAATTRSARRGSVVVFLDTANETVPFPVPCAPAITVNHGALLAADHPHDGAAVTATVPEPASFENDVRSGEATYSHEALTPTWLTVIGSPAMLNVPVRAPLVSFGAALNVTTAVPDPLEPLVIDSQLDWDVAVQVHPLWAVTVTEPDPPVAWNENEDVDRL